MTLTDYFGKIATQFRSRTNLPIWISEFYGGWSSNPQFTAANHASCYLHALHRGVSVALLWDAELPKWNYLFTSTKTAEGGPATAAVGGSGSDKPSNDRAASIPAHGNWNGSVGGPGSNQLRNELMKAARSVATTEKQSVG
ncbi:MAG TPA: hypothetical protein VKO18_10990 [Terriglobia bacterium]|nr:hypothetical protein [Terriglobia bacterium]